MQRLHQQVLLAVDGLLAQAEGRVLHDGAHAGGGEHAAQTGAAGPDHLCQGALRDQVDLQGLVHHVLSGHVGGHTHMGGDDALDLLVMDQLGHAVQISVGAGRHAAVVANDGKTAFAVLRQSVNDLVGAAAPQEAAEHDSGPIGNHRYGFLNRNNFCHSFSLLLLVW